MSSYYGIESELRQRTACVLTNDASTQFQRRRTPGYTGRCPRSLFSVYTRFYYGSLCPIFTARGGKNPCRIRGEKGTHPRRSRGCRSAIIDICPLLGVAKPLIIICRHYIALLYGRCISRHKVLHEQPPLTRPATPSFLRLPTTLTLGRLLSG